MSNNWEVRKYDYKADEVDTVFDGSKQGACRAFVKFIRANKNPDDVCYVLNKWTTERYWDGRGWATEEPEIAEQYEDDSEFAKQLMGVQV